MCNQIIAPKITPYMRKQVLLQQNYKCARKPYSRIKGLEGYHCRLWRKKGSVKGSIEYSPYVIIKIDNNRKSTKNNLIALCKCCYNVLIKRKYAHTYDSQSTTDDESSCDDLSSDDSSTDDSSDNTIEYICNKCKREFDDISTYTRHMKRKTDCAKKVRKLKSSIPTNNVNIYGKNVYVIHIGDINIKPMRSKSWK